MLLMKLQQGSTLSRSTAIFLSNDTTFNFLQLNLANGLKFVMLFRSAYILNYLEVCFEAKAFICSKVVKSKLFYNRKN